MNPETRISAHLLSAQAEVMTSGHVTIDPDGLCHFETNLNQPLPAPKDVASMRKDTTGAVPEVIEGCHISGSTGVGCKLHFRLKI